MDRKSIIRYILDALLVVVFAFGSWSFGKISTLEKNQIIMGTRLESVETSLTEFTIGVNKLTDAVEALVLEQKIQTRLKKYQMSDRWTSEMMEEFQDIWYDVISGFHPDLSLGDIPNINHIQAENLPVDQE